MLKKSYRLRSSTDIQSVLKRGTYRHIGELAMVKWLANDRDHHRVTMVVSLKVNKKAVARNRIRRVVLEAIPAEFLEESTDTHYDIVIVAKKISEETLQEAKDKIIKTIEGISSSKK